MSTPHNYKDVRRRRSLRALVTVGALAISAMPSIAQRGYVIVGDQVRINRASHWRAWQGASSLVQITPNGSITPLLIRKGTNAALDAAHHAVTGTAGGIQAGSNPTQARRVIDGNPSTSWGPDPSAPLADWWLELDLGRLVVVRNIVIRFAEQGQGDPLLQFKVLAWRQPPPRSTAKYTLAGTSTPKFWEIGRTTRPNKSQRVFEFEPRPTETADATFIGDPIERIQLIATHSDTSRAFEVTGAQYEALPSSQRGAIDHYRLTLAGSVRQVSQAEYDGFSAERRGPIRYFRRELPRIAEIEVIAVGDNLNLGLDTRGGSAVIETSGGDYKDISGVIADGNYNKGHNGSIFSKQYQYLEDLGGLFWVDTMHFLTDGASAIEEIRADVSDGSRAPDGSISYVPIVHDAASDKPGRLRFREIRMPPQKVRYLRARFANPLSGLSYIGFTEVMLYGAGYVPGVELTSDLIELGQSRSLTSIEWDGERPAGTSINIQTRTGNELQQNTIYHDSNGIVVLESRYKRLPSSRRGEVTTTAEPGGDWSPWSTAYAASGAEIVSPSPRQYLQLRATLETDLIDVAATLRSVVVNMADPVAQRLVGEIWPLHIDQIGESEEFTLYLRADFAGATQGFDEVRLTATAGTTMQLLSVHRGTERELETGTGASLTTLRTDAGGWTDTLQVLFPERVTGNPGLLALRFRATLFANSASFRSFVRDGIGGHWQPVNEGDATAFVGSERATVLALAGQQVLTNLTVVPPVFSPNGDGVNDEQVFRFAVSRISGTRPVTLSIHDLAGRLVRRLIERRQDARGQYELVWDGADAQGDLVAPGLYLVRIGVDVDSGDAERTSAQCVVYVTY
jgi:hypothetical protein